MMGIVSDISLVEFVTHVNYDRSVGTHRTLQFSWDLLEHRLLESHASRRRRCPFLLLDDSHESFGLEQPLGGIDNALITDPSAGNSDPNAGDLIRDLVDLSGFHFGLAK